MKNKKIILAGGTGFIGQSLAKYFGKENRVVILSRQSVHTQNNRYSHTLAKASEGYNITYWRWDGRSIEKHWAQEVEGSDLVINLAGKSVNCRYSEKNKQAILDSRLQPTAVLGEVIRQCIIPPKLWINAVSATIYQHSLAAPNDEYGGLISEQKKDNMPYSSIDQIRFKWKRWIRSWKKGKESEEVKNLDLDFSVQVCKRWEQSFFEQRTPFTRKIALRTAITLGEGGVMVPYFNLLKFGLGGYQGNGQQMVSWIHIDDIARSIEWLFDHPTIEGVYNCSAPHPVTNKEFMDRLRELTGNRFGLAAYSWMLEIGTALMGTESELILKSRWVLPTKLVQSGFTFKYPFLKEALEEIVDKTPRKQYHLF